MFHKGSPGDQNSEKLILKQPQHILNTIHSLLLQYSQHVLTSPSVVANHADNLVGLIRSPSYTIFRQSLYKAYTWSRQGLDKVWIRSGEGSEKVCTQCVLHKASLQAWTKCTYMYVACTPPLPKL